MPRPVVPISDITPSTKNWSARILVIQKMHPRHSQSSSKATSYQRFLFIDGDGTKVQAITYGSDMSAMEDVLQLLETYYITNARVTVIEAKYQIVPHQYQWVINKSTSVRHVMHDALPRELGFPNFTRFTDIPSLVNSRPVIDILAIVVDKLEPRTVNTKYGVSNVQEFCLINEERLPMMLTLWNESVYIEGQLISDTSEKMPIIAAIRINVSDYNGMSLAAKVSSSIVVNPPYPQTQGLRDWRSNNHVFLTEIFEEKEYLKRSAPLPVIPRDNYSSIADVTTTDKAEKSWIKATATIINHSQNFWYMGCSLCLGRTSEQYDWNFTCRYCNAEAVAKPRTRFILTFSNHTSQLNATIFGELAEKILGLFAIELMNKYEKDELVNCDEINIRLSGHQFFVQLKKREVSAALGRNYQYNVLSLVEIEQASTQYQSLPSSSTSSYSADPAASTSDDAATTST